MKPGLVVLKNEEIADTLSNLISYQTELLNEAKKNIDINFAFSYKAYAEYYYKIGDYDRSVQMASLLNFK